MVPDPDRLLELAIAAATDAGSFLLAGITDVRTTVETKSSATDMVTEMDRSAERRIVDAIRAARPDDGILGEEGTADAGGTGVRWIIDPLDGTTNYLYGYPAFSVSIAAEVDGEVAVGVVNDPVHGDLFSAVRTQGAWRNATHIHVNQPEALATALIGTGFAYVPERRAWQGDVLARVLPAVRDIRRGGSAALDLCWVACGRLDGFYERGLQYWDYAAGALIATEAGAWVGDLDGGPPSSDIVVAAAANIAPRLREVVRDAEASA